MLPAPWVGFRVTVMNLWVHKVSILISPNIITRGRNIELSSKGLGRTWKEKVNSYLSYLFTF